MTTKYVCAIVLAAGLTACAGRAPAPVAVSQVQDATSSCMAAQAEIEANNRKIEELSSEKGAKVAQNVAAGVAGLFIWPLWFAMDFRGAASTDMAAYEARNAYLGQLALEKCTQVATQG